MCLITSAPSAVILCLKGTSQATKHFLWKFTTKKIACKLPWWRSSGPGTQHNVYESRKIIIKKKNNNDPSLVLLNSNIKGNEFTCWMPWWTCHCGSRPDGAEGSRWLSTWSWHHLLLWRSDYEGLPTPWGSLEAKQQIIQNKFITLLSVYLILVKSCWLIGVRHRGDNVWKDVPLAGGVTAVVTSDDVQHHILLHHFLSVG